MLRKTSFAAFRGAEVPTAATLPELDCAIRTDSCFATSSIKNSLIRAIRNEGTPALFNIASRRGRTGVDLEVNVKGHVHNAYKLWAHYVLHILSDCLDYSRYGFDRADGGTMNVHFHDARSLAGRAIAQAGEMARQDPDYKPGVPHMCISLDEMIPVRGDEGGEISFSRLFSLSGDQQFGYVGRPGHEPLEDQIRNLGYRLEALKRANGGDNIPIVFLEDNVRHARMLNWVIHRLDEQNIFDHARLAGISTCLCSASQQERENIRHNGRIIPLAAVIDHDDRQMEVITPRDFLFDGYVVNVEGRYTRLPSLFMDIEHLLKIHPDKLVEFKDRVLQASIEFCDDLEGFYKIPLQLGWFKGADAISHVTGHAPETPMKSILASMMSANAPAPDISKGAIWVAPERYAAAPAIA